MGRLLQTKLPGNYNQVFDNPNAICQKHKRRDELPQSRPSTHATTIAAVEPAQRSLTLLKGKPVVYFSGEPSKWLVSFWFPFNTNHHKVKRPKRTKLEAHTPYEKQTPTKKRCKNGFAWNPSFSSNPFGRVSFKGTLQEQSLSHSPARPLPPPRASGSEAASQDCPKFADMVCVPKDHSPMCPA